MAPEPTLARGGVRLGVDVGGTNTDAVLFADGAVLASAKVPTSPDLTDGIAAAVRSVRAAVPRGQVALEVAVVGTTHFVNAVTQARGLAEVAAIRLATPPQTIEPMDDWPAALRTALGDHRFVCAGGAQYDGGVLNELDEQALAELAHGMVAAGVRHAAITAVFSPIDAAHERRAGELLRALVPGLDVSLSHELGRIGILERENATILNAALRPLADDVIGALEEILRDESLDAPLFLSQNDGTLMDLAQARRMPILTTASGATNSMRGGARRAGLDDCVVIDVGGTTTEVGLVRHGIPREAAVAIGVGGVRTNFRMPDVISLGIGGGSLVADDGTVGPQSVGYRLTDEALVFGGATLTLTDVAVAAGIADVGERAAVAGLAPALVARALDSVRERLADAVDAVKLDAADVPVVAVGGGAALIDRLPGHGAIVRPPDGAVANAIGAAQARVGGEVDRIHRLDRETRADARREGRREAIARAVAAGADPQSVHVVEEEDVPLTHLPEGAATRVRVKAVGELRSAAAA